MRAGPCRNADEIGMAHHCADGRSCGRWRIDHNRCNPEETQLLKILLDIFDVADLEDKSIVSTRVSPLRQTALGVGIDDRDRPCAGQFRLHSNMAGKRGFARPPFLRSQYDDLLIRRHDGVPFLAACQFARKRLTNRPNETTCRTRTRLTKQTANFLSSCNVAASTVFPIQLDDTLG